MPGSHLTTPITKRFVRLPEGGTSFEQLAAFPPSPSDISEKTNEISDDGSEGKYVLETCESGRWLRVFQISIAECQILGDLVLIHGSVLHKSERNTSAHTRYAYTFHMIDSSPYAEYDEKNWLQPTEVMPFSRILDVPNESTRSTAVH